MPTQKRFDIATPYVRTILDLISAAAHTAGPTVARFAKQIESQLLSDVAEAAKTKATEFKNISEAAMAFDLTYEEKWPTWRENYLWNIEDSPETMNFVTGPRIETLMRNYYDNFDRSTEAGCRIGIDIILNECLTVMKGNALETQLIEDIRPRTPNRWDRIMVHCEVPFSHEILTPVGEFSPGSIVSGRVDQSIGFVIRSRTKAPNYGFHSLLLVIDAKVAGCVNQALPQLIVYLACLRHSRLQRQRNNASVYGVASDGFTFIFVAISHEGVLKRSKTFDILETPEDLRVVLGCLKYVLETTADMSPNLTPERNGPLNGGHPGQTVDETGDADEPMLLDNRPDEDEADDKDVYFSAYY